jgi:uncharacterized protein VirK/YbjX
MLKALTIVYREALVANTPNSAILRLLSALRILLFPRCLWQFHSMEILKKLYNPARGHDPLYFLTHKYYISRHFTLWQRVQSAMIHHQFELENYICEYARQIYRSSGILLWERSVDNFHFTIVLVATEDNRHEGDLSVILSVDNIRLCRMSFCYLNARIFGRTSQTTMLISRNQTDRVPGRDLFNRCFKQNTPQLFCLSAVCGIAMANEFKAVLGIKHDAQIAYEETLDSGFRNSYSALWEKFDAVECDGHVYRLNVPLKVRPLSFVNRAHRARAHDRRRHWNDIVQSAASRLLDYRTPVHIGPLP